MDRYDELARSFKPTMSVEDDCECDDCLQSWEKEYVRLASWFRNGLSAERDAMVAAAYERAIEAAKESIYKWRRGQRFLQFDGADIEADMRIRSREGHIEMAPCVEENLRAECPDTGEAEMSERTYTQAEVNAMIAATIQEAAKIICCFCAEEIPIDDIGHHEGERHCYAFHIRKLAPADALALRETDARRFIDSAISEKIEREKEKG